MAIDSRHNNKQGTMNSTSELHRASLAEPSLSPHPSLTEANSEIDDQIIDILSKFREAKSSIGVIPPTVESVAINLIRTYAKAKRLRHLELLHEKFSRIDPSSVILASSAEHLFAIYTGFEQPQYDKAESVLKELISSLKHSTPLCATLATSYRLLAKLYSRQLSRSTKEVLSRHGLLSERSFAIRMKQRPYAELLIRLENLRLHEQINIRARSLLGEISRLQFRDNESLAACWLHLGKCFHTQKHYVRAEHCYQRALATLKRLKSASDVASRTVLKLGNVFFRTSRASSAARLYADPSLSALMPPCVHTAYVHSRLGDLHIDDCEFLKAESCYAAAQDVLESVDAPVELFGELLLRKALCLLLESRYQESYDALCRAESAFACATSQKGVVLRKEMRPFVRRMLIRYPANLLSQYVLSEEELEWTCSSDILSEAGKGEKQAERAGLGCLHIGKSIELRNSSESKKWYFHALSILARVDYSPKTVSKLALKAAKLYYSTKEFSVIKTMLRTALDSCGRSDPQSQECASLLEASGDYLLKENPYQTELAEQCYRSAYTLRKLSCAYELANTTFEALTRVYRSTEEFEKLESLYREHLEFLPQLYKPECRITLAKSYESRGLFEESEKCYFSLLETFHQSARYDCTYISILTQFGDCYNLQLRTSRAEACYREAAALFQPRHPALQSVIASYSLRLMRWPLKSIVSFFKLKRKYAFLESFLRNVVEAVREKAELAAEPLTLLGKVYKKLGRREEAEACFREVMHHSSRDTVAASKLLRLYPQSIWDEKNCEIKELRKVSADVWKPNHSIEERYAEFHEKNNRLAEAEACYLKALELKAEDEDRWEGMHSDLLERLGSFYHRRKRSLEANLCFEKCEETMHSSRDSSAELTTSWKQTDPPGKLAQFQAWANHRMRSSVYRRDTESILYESLEAQRIEYSSYKSPALTKIVSEPVLKFKVFQGDESSTLDSIVAFIKFHLRADSTDPRLAAAYCSLATHYADLLKPEAEQAYQSAIHIFSSIDSNLVYARQTAFNLAKFYAKVHRYADAAEILTMLDWPARKDSVAFALGEVYLQQQKFSEAEACFQAAAATREKLNPTSPATAEALERLAAVYELTDRLSEAEHCDLKAVYFLSLRGVRLCNNFEAVEVAQRLSRRKAGAKAERVLLLFTKEGKCFLRNLYQ